MTDMHACRADASRRNKGDRLTSRRAAMSVLAAMATGGAAMTPQVVRCAGGRRIELTTLAQRVVYREVAAVLQGGMNAHLQSNQMLGELLRVDADSPGSGLCTSSAFHGVAQGTEVCLYLNALLCLDCLHRTRMPPYVPQCIASILTAAPKNQKQHCFSSSQREVIREHSEDPPSYAHRAGTL
jgi:hypothetical protein